MVVACTTHLQYYSCMLISLDIISSYDSQAHAIFILTTGGELICNNESIFERTIKFKLFDLSLKISMELEIISWKANR